MARASDGNACRPIRPMGIAAESAQRSFVRGRPNQGNGTHDGSLCGRSFTSAKASRGAIPAAPKHPAKPKSLLRSRAAYFLRILRVPMSTHAPTTRQRTAMPAMGKLPASRTVSSNGGVSTSALTVPSSYTQVYVPSSSFRTGANLRTRLSVPVIRSVSLMGVGEWLKCHA